MYKRLRSFKPVVVRAVDMYSDEFREVDIRIHGASIDTRVVSTGSGKQAESFVWLYADVPGQGKTRIGCDEQYRFGGPEGSRVPRTDSASVKELHFQKVREVSRYFGLN